MVSGEIGQVLKARVTDANKAVQTLALDIVARIATGMGKPFEKQSRFFVLPVSTVLADQKGPIRAAALQTLNAIAEACETLESMVNGIGTALESSNPLQKASLLNWIADWFKTHEPTPGLDLTSWAGPVVSSLDDRNVDVRKGAQAVLPTLVTCAGYDYVLHQTNSLKPASRSSAVPLIQAARGAAPEPAVPPPAKVTAKAPAKAPSSKTAPAKVRSVTPPPEEEEPVPAPVSAKPSIVSKLGVRRKLPLGGTTSRPESRAETPVEAPTSKLPNKLGTGLKRPGAAPKSVATPPPVSVEPLPLLGRNIDAKKARLGKDGTRWVNEAGPTKKELAELLQHQMEPQASRDLLGLLFSHDHNAVNDHVSGLGVLQDFFSAIQTGDDRYGLDLEELRIIGISNSDLAFKYVSMKAHEPQSNLVQKCLDVVEAALSFLQSVDYQLSDPEALCFIPTMIYKVSNLGSSLIVANTIAHSLATPVNLSVFECKTLYSHCRRFMDTAEYLISC